jgi:crotonobetainyl-CoA:carnitine CoA-transferase CaiB-like acyl-CoA transferase
VGVGPGARPGPERRLWPRDGGSQTTQPLSDIVVLDLTEWVGGPYCTKLLADYGARVVKVERPGGDPARGMGPFPDDRIDGERSGMFLHLNTNKESVVIDGASVDGAAIIRALALRADIVVESYRPGTLAGWGLAPDELIAAKPPLVVTSVTPFGQYGPYRDMAMTEIVAFAMGGPMNASGNAEREPVRLVGNVVQMQSGATASVATLAALMYAQAQGVGQHVDVATFETQNGSLDRRRYYLLSYEYSGTVTRRATVVGAGRPAAGGRFEAADGVYVTTGRIWPDHVVRMVGVLGDERISRLWADKGLEVMTEHAHDINEAIARWVSNRQARNAMREAQKVGWPVVVVNDPLLLLDDDHLQARGFWVDAPHPAAGTLPYTGAPFRVVDGGWSLRRTAPILGQDTERVLAELAGVDRDRMSVLRSKGVVA